MEKPSFAVAVVMQCRPAKSRWAGTIWEPWSVLPGFETGEPRLLVEKEGLEQWLHPGFKLVLHRDEAEGYYMNVSARDPRVMVLWRMELDRGIPVEVTVSYDEGGRWVGEYVEQNYRPEPKKRIKPRSFVHPKDRVG